MNFPPYYTYLLFICNIALGIKGVDSITTIPAALGAISLLASYAGYNYINCINSECCAKNWTNFNYLGLEQDLQDHVFGQHFVDHIIPRSLKGHIQNPNPKKALVMSFHGGTGCGKNHVSQIIAKNLYKSGTESDNQHLYIGSRDFAHKQDIHKHKATLRKDIEESTKNCGQSLFIFDEVHKMVPGVLDALKPYIDYHDQLDGVNYRKNIFIFLSNAGSANITAVALKFWSEGKIREDITLKDIEHLISEGAFNEVGGLQHSEIVKRDLIDVYVPFLPLEQKHVKQCALVALRRKKGVVPSDNILNEIANQLVYVPPETELYSVSGCKKIEQKVELFADQNCQKLRYFSLPTWDFGFWSGFGFFSYASWNFSWFYVLALFLMLLCVMIWVYFPFLYICFILMIFRMTRKKSDKW